MSFKLLIIDPPSSPSIPISMSQPIRRYDLSDLLQVVNNMDTNNARERLSSTDEQSLKQYSTLCTNLKQEELKQERKALFVVTGAGVSHRGLATGTQPLRPPVSKFAKEMWPDRDECNSNDQAMSDERMNEEEIKVIDFAIPADETASQQGPRFASERERQLYYRPREWRRRRNGEWADTGPHLCGQAE